MLNKIEKGNVCDLIAQWEWTQGGSSSEASARGRCAKQLCKLFGLSDQDEDLIFARAYEIQKLIGVIYSDAREDAFLYLLDDMITEDYEGTVELLESGHNFEEFMKVAREKL